MNRRMLRLKLWQTHRIAKGTPQDCQRNATGIAFGLVLMQKKDPHTVQVFYNNLELTYFPGFDPSIISGAGLNFSVRDGKR